MAAMTAVAAIHREREVVLSKIAHGTAVAVDDVDVDGDDVNG